MQLNTKQFKTLIKAFDNPAIQSPMALPNCKGFHYYNRDRPIVETYLSCYLCKKEEIGIITKPTLKDVFCICCGEVMTHVGNFTVTDILIHQTLYNIRKCCGSPTLTSIDWENYETKEAYCLFCGTKKESPLPLVREFSINTPDFIKDYVIYIKDKLNNYQDIYFCPYYGDPIEIKDINLNPEGILFKEEKGEWVKPYKQIKQDWFENNFSMAPILNTGAGFRRSRKWK